MDLTSNNNNNRPINPLRLSNQFLSLPPLTSRQQQQQPQQPFIPNPIPFVTIVGPLQSNAKNKINNNNNYNNKSAAFQLTTKPPDSLQQQSNQFSSGQNHHLSNSWQLYDVPNPTNKIITNKKQPIIIYPNNNKKQHTNNNNNNNHRMLKNEKRKNPSSSSSSSLVNNKKLSNVSYNRAKRCIPERCQPPDCRCGGLDIPGLIFFLL